MERIVCVCMYVCMCAGVHVSLNDLHVIKFLVMAMTMMIVMVLT